MARNQYSKMRPNCHHFGGGNLCRVVNVIDRIGAQLPSSDYNQQFHCLRLFWKCSPGLHASASDSCVISYNLSFCCLYRWPGCVGEQDNAVSSSRSVLALIGQYSGPFFTKPHQVWTKASYINAYKTHRRFSTVIFPYLQLLHYYRTTANQNITFLIDFDVYPHRGLFFSNPVHFI